MKSMWQRHGCIYNVNNNYAQVPFIELMQDKWRIYFTTRVNSKSIPVYIDTAINNLRNIKSVQSECLLNLGTSVSFDEDGVMPMCSITINNKKHIYYAGFKVQQDVPYRVNVGLAISSIKNEQWFRYSIKPILTHKHTPSGIHAPACIIKAENSLIMFYVAYTGWVEEDKYSKPEHKLNGVYNINYTTSTDGINWSTPGVSLASNIDHTDHAVMPRSIVKVNEKYLLFYSVRKTKNHRHTTDCGYRIRCMESADLINWNQINTYNFDPSPVHENENIMVCYPYVFLYEQELHMLYNGNEFGKTGIYYATFKL